MLALIIHGPLLRSSLWGLSGGDSSALAELQRRKLAAAKRSEDAAGSGGARRYQWAVADHSDVSDFHSAVPQPAISFPFELDTFQKQAVKHLEKVGGLLGCMHACLADSHRLCVCWLSDRASACSWPRTPLPARR
jgi:hypothetical protein